MTGIRVRLVVALALLAALAVGGASAAGAVLTGGSSTGARAAAFPDGDWPTFDYNAQRTGVGPAQTGITAQNLGTLKRQVINLPGTVDASAVQLHDVMVEGSKRDVIVVETSYGRTLAIAPWSGKILWRFAPKDIGSYQGSPQITQATPVFDPDRQYVYSVSPDGYVHKLVLANGKSLWSTRVTWDPTHEKLNELNITGPYLIVTVGGYNGDAPPYQGHVVLINRATGRIAYVWNSLCSNHKGLIDPPSSCPASDSSIWGRSGGVVDPSTGDILVATGNAPFNGTTNWGDSVLELSPTLTPLRHWTPTNQEDLNVDDLDLGSTSPALLPGGLAIQGGKSGTIALLNLSTLPSMTGSGGPRLGGAIQNISTPGGAEMLASAAVWQHSGRTYVFVGTDGGTGAYLLGADRQLHVAWTDSFDGTSPVIAGGLLYVYDEGDGVLQVLNPTSGHIIKTLAAAGGHWNSPIIIGGRIILPVGNADDQQTTGQLYIWHLPGR
jgi:polyvinyl alcohol dehydrogenase (cytochrome)